MSNSEVNRLIEPEVEKVSSVSLFEPKHFSLANGVHVYAIAGGRQDVIKTEVVFPAGSRYQQMPLQSISCNKLMCEGTKKHDSVSLAEALDFYGAYLENECNTDTAAYSLYSLSKHIEPTLSLLSEILSEPIFPEEEFDIYRQNALQSFKTRNKKVSEIASAEFHKMLFGNKHFYGYRTVEEDYHTLNNAAVKDFFGSTYMAHKPFVVIAGKPASGWEKTLDNILGKLPVGGNVTANNAEPEATEKTKSKIHVEGALQCAIRVGKRLFSKNHPDYLPLTIVNTILGGYFGSRLMKNIREDKGYTYGIGSGLVSRQLGGFFYIASEVGADVTQNALDEVYKELHKMCTEPVPTEELNLVKNYLMGQFLRGADGVFSQAERFLSVHLYGLDYSYYRRYLDILETIHPEQIMQLSAKYLSPESMSELVVGKTHV
jgi:predicted Zn-dependent peptidase